MSIVYVPIYSGMVAPTGSAAPISADPSVRAGSPQSASPPQGMDVKKMADALYKNSNDRSGGSAYYQTGENALGFGQDTSVLNGQGYPVGGTGNWLNNSDFMQGGGYGSFLGGNPSSYGGMGGYGSGGYGGY